MNYIAIIKQHTFSGIDVFDIVPTFLVGSDTYNSDIYWYASCILHDAIHSLLCFEITKKTNISVSNLLLSNKKFEFDINLEHLLKKLLTSFLK